MDIRIGLSVIGPYLLGGFAALLIVLGLVFALRARLTAWLVALSPESEFRDIIARLALIVALSITCLLASLEILASLGFFAGASANALEFALAAFVSAMGVALAARHYFKVRWVSVALAILIFTSASFVLLLGVAGSFYDASWDGNSTHQVATVELAQGWNPVHNPSVHNRTGEWQAIEYFSKGAWIRNAVVYRLSGRLEQAKANNLLLVLASLAAWLALLLAIAPRRPRAAVLGSLLIALNPISVQQSFTFLVDGQVSSLMVLVVAYAGLLFTSLGQWPALLALGAALAMLATVKFTGLVFAVLLSAGVALAVMIRRRTLAWRPILVYLVAALAVGILVTGFNPYVVNTARYGSPFYPLVGAKSVDIISTLEPPNFVGKSNLERLALSLFSRSADFGTATHLKVPFSVAPSEIRPYLGFQTPVAGFGPWFGGALLVAVLLVVLLLADPRYRSDRRVQWALYAVAVILVSALANPEAWWARYSPQLWLVPTIVGLASVLGGPRKWQRTLGWALCTVLLFDAV